MFLSLRLQLYGLDGVVNHLSAPNGSINCRIIGEGNKSNKKKTLRSFLFLSKFLSRAECLEMTLKDYRAARLQIFFFF